MTNKRSGRKILGSYVAGLVQTCFGGSGALVSAVVAIGGGFVWSGMNTAWVAAFIVLFLLCFWLLVRGVYNITMSSHSKRIQNVLAGKDREKLALLARATQQDLTTLVRELRLLAKKGYFPGAYVDLYRRDFVVSSGGELPPFTPGETVLREVHKRSVFPVYAMLFTFVAYTLIVRPILWHQFVIGAVASLVVFIILFNIIPKHIVIVEEKREAPPPPPPPEAINTGNEELDEVLNTAMGYMQELTALDVAITNERIDGPIMELVHICQQIFDYIRKNPAKVKQIRQFMSFYLPTTIKLLKNYDDLSREPMKGDNIKTAMTKIEDNMQDVLTAFQKELDSLYQDTALDIAVDIEVMQNMMEEEGLKGN
jgi:hypothetical protein